MTGRTAFEGGLEILAVELIERYLVGNLSEIVWPSATAIQVPDGSSLNTLRAIIRGLDQKVRAFEITCQRAKGANIQFSSLMKMPTEAVEAI